MKLFVIPSWYETPDAPESGCFFRRHSKLFANMYQESIVAYCRVDIEQSRPSLSLDCLKFLRNLFCRNRIITDTHNNFVDYFVWYPRLLPTRGMEHRVRCAEHCFEKFTKTYGKPDIIQAHSVDPAGYIAWKLSQKYHVPYVITEHNTVFFIRKINVFLDQHSWFREVFQNAAKVITVSHYLGDQLRHLNLCQSSEIIPNMIDEQEFTYDLDKKQKNKTPFVFLSVGGLQEQKGFDILLQAFAGMKHRNDCRLTIVGNGPDRESLMQLAISLKCNIEFVGNVKPSEIQPFYQTCDAFVLASRIETFGCVYAEALCCGKPIIATNCGGVLDIINPDNGILVPSEDISRLSDAMDFMFENRYQYIDQEISYFALEKFSAKNVIPLIYSLFESVIQGQGKTET